MKEVEKRHISGWW